MKTNILGISFDVVTADEALNKALAFLDGGEPRTVFTPNPEFVMTARRDPEFAEILNKADMLVPDGIGIVLASKLNKIKLPGRVPGCELVLNIFANIKDTGKTVYFFGGKPGVPELAKEKMEKAYPGLKIIGTANGFFDEAKEEEIIADIIGKKPDILLVGTGFPKEEKWINANKGKLGVKLYMGVGGTLDVMAGTVPRAPKIFRTLGLEWFYRLIRQPHRFKRQLALPVFAALVIKEKIFGGFKEKK